MSRRPEGTATNEAAWIDWDGKDGNGPLTPRALVEVRVRDGYEHRATSVGWWASDGSPECSNWLDNGQPYCIVAYRAVSA